MFTCIDMSSRKVFLEMQHHGPRFKGDDQRAREHIADRALGNDRLASKAVRAVFRSKVGTKGRTAK